MHIDREQLEAQFRGLSDEELLERCRTDLTELARDVALAEAERRGLSLAARAAMNDAEGTEVAPGHGPLCLCARYLNPIDAQVLAARLQSEGLAARVLDADTVYANGALFGSLSLGGVRVMVPESQLEDAQRIRAAFDAGEYAIDEDFDVNQ
jgi:Putative prokaryotic signal transducing protein